MLQRVLAQRTPAELQTITRFLGDLVAEVKPT